MREICFRAKGQTENKWHYGLLSYYTECIAHISENGKTFICNAVTLGQYTGLTDKNGVKIFEGDILKRTYTKGELEQFELLVISYEMGCFYANKLGYMTASPLGYYVTLAKGNTCEVIGNIHENPELLGGDGV